MTKHWTTYSWKGAKWFRRNLHSLQLWAAQNYSYFVLKEINPTCNKQFEVMVLVDLVLLGYEDPQKKTQRNHKLQDANQSCVRERCIAASRVWLHFARAVQNWAVQIACNSWLWWMLYLAMSTERYCFEHAKLTVFDTLEKGRDCGA